MDGKGTGIHWISGKSLEDLEYVDDLALMSHSFDHIQEKNAMFGRSGSYSWLKN